MHPFIATLATQVIIYGACSLYFDMPPNNSQPIGGVRDDFALLGQFKIGAKAFGTKFPGISILVPIALVVLVAIWFVLNKTVFGKNVYAIGGNRQASYLAGINVDRIKLFTFMLCSMLASVAAMIHAAQISQGGPNEGSGYELNAVAACAIGGTSLAGGKGTMLGTLIGALILGMLDNVLGLKGVNSNLQLMVKGFLIIIAVFMQAERKE